MRRHSRFLWNGVRLAASFAFGIGAVALVTPLGVDALGLYLYLLGWRWTLQFVIDAAEAAALSCHADGAPPGRASLWPMVLFAIVVLALSVPLGWRLAGPDYHLALSLGVLANAVIVATQIFAAPRLAKWVLDGAMGRYNRYLLIRRAGEFLAVAVAVCLTPVAPAVLVGQALLLVVAALFAFALLPPTLVVTNQRGPDQTFRQRAWQSAMIGASTSLAARAPAVILPVFGGHEIGILAGVMVLLLGYVRQAGSVVLSGLDGEARRKANPMSQSTAAGRWGAVFWAGAGLALFGLAWAAIVPFISLVLPGDLGGVNPTDPGLLFALRCALLGAAIRLWAEARIKLLSGFGGLGRTGGHAIAPTALYGVALAVIAAHLRPETAILAAAFAYLGLQIVLFGIVTLQVKVLKTSGRFADIGSRSGAPS